MNTDFSELNVMQLSDSFFPSGLYTMSNGLETVFDEKRITTADGIQEFIHTIITQQVGPADCVALLNAYDFAKDDDVNGIIKCDNALHLIQKNQCSCTFIPWFATKTCSCIVSVT